MPHSTTPAAEPVSTTPAPTPMEEDLALAASSSPEPEMDSVMVEAGDVQGVVENTTSAVEPISARTQPDADEDMVVEIQQEKRPEIKLEDMFAGMDSDDDEFPSSSNPQNEQEPR